MTWLSEADRRRVSEAIQKAEQKTSGEIVAVIAGQSDSYFYVPFLWAGVAALLVPWPLIYLTTWSLTAIYLTQLVVFGAIVGLLYPMRRRAMLVPAAVKALHVERRAIEQFFMLNLHTTESRTGVMIFVSVAERQARILADKAIDAKVPAGTWQSIVDQLVIEIGKGRPADGFVAAITTSGEHLAANFPPGRADTDELPNHLIVIE